MTVIRFGFRHFEFDAFFYAGAGGFEPPDAGTKTLCLAAWRRPSYEFKLETLTRNLWIFYPS